MLLILSGELDAAMAQELTRRLAPLLAIDQKLAAIDLELYPYTPSQQAARIVLQRCVQAIAQEYLDPTLGTFARLTPDEPLTLCFQNDPEAKSYLPWCDVVEKAPHDWSGRYWEALLSGAVPSTDPFCKAAVETGYMVVVSKDQDGNFAFEALFPSILGLGKHPDPDAAWSAITRDYLTHFCTDVDRGDRVNLPQAVAKAQVVRFPNEDAFFVVSDVEYSTANKMQTLVGWRVDSSGFKLGGRDAVRVSACGLPALTHKEFDMLRDESLEPYISGKGALNCSILDSEGTVVREVSQKARLDFSHFGVMPRGEPFLVNPAGLTHPFAFDPFTQPDPVTREMYTQFCFVDDAGIVLSVDAKTRVAQRQEVLADTARQVVMDAPAG